MSGTLHKPTLQRVLAYIDDRLTADLSLTDIARITGMSVSHLSARFKNSLGVPLHRYILQRRVERAVDLITLSVLSLSDIALQTGFANQSHMAMAVRPRPSIKPHEAPNAMGKHWQIDARVSRTF